MTSPATTPIWTRPDELDRLHQEIRDLNTALTEANTALVAYQREIASYRALPLVPAAEHRRVTEQRDDALRLADALTRELANKSDSRMTRLAEQSLRAWQDEIRDASKEWHTEARKDRHNRVRAMLVEAGMGSGWET